MISFRIQTLVAVVAGAASLLAGAAHAGAPCSTAADCAGDYRPASPAYAFAPPGPAYANEGYAQQGAYPTGYVAREHIRHAPVRHVREARVVGYDRAALGPAYAGGAYAAQGYAAGGGYATYQAGYAAPVPCASNVCAPLPPPPVDCGAVCVPAYQVVQLPPQEVALASDVYTGGVGVTEFGGGGGGGFNGNFEVQGFGDVSAFTSAHAQAQADAVSYARSMAYAQATAKANASAQANVNVNVKLNASFHNKTNYCNTCNKPPQPVNCNCVKPQPVTCNTCGGVGGGSWGGGMKMGMAPSPRGGWVGRRH